MNICKDKNRGFHLYMDPPYAHTKGMYEGGEACRQMDDMDETGCPMQLYVPL